MADASITPFRWERTALAVEKVKGRLRRVSAGLGQAGVLYAVVGGNAVAEWVGRVDALAVRNTPDVDILLRRSDLEAEKKALGANGFFFTHARGKEVFLDGPKAKTRDAVKVVFAGEKVQPESLFAAPDLSDSEPAAQFQVLTLPALVQMKLDSNRCKDRVHILDLISVGLIDGSWPGRFPPELAARLKHLLDTPEG